VAAVGLLGWLAGLDHAAWLWDRNSDNSWQLVAGWDFAAGDWRLHGWTLSPYSGWLTEIPVYALGARRGGGRELLYQAPTAIYALVALAASGCAALAARPGRRALAGLLAFGLVGLTTPFVAYTALQGGIHVGTTLFALLTLLVLAAALRRPGWLAAGFVLAAAGAVSDPLFVVVAGAPAVAGGIVAAFRDPARRGAWAALAGGAGAGAGQVLRSQPILHAFSFEALGIGRSPIHTWPAHVELAAQGIGMLLGAGGWRLPGWLGLALAVLSATAVIAAAATGGRRALGREDAMRRFLIAALLAGCVADVVAFVASTAPVDIFTSRYLLPAVVMGSIVLAAEAAQARVTATAAAVLAAAHVYLFASLATAPVLPVSPSLDLAHWLRARGLTRGYAPYWVANVITAQSGDGVRARPVIAAGGRLAPFHYASNAAWFSAADGTARFVVFADEGVPGPDLGFPTVSVTSVSDGVDAQSAASTFGAPDGVERVGPYEVLIWGRPLPELGG
jgi:hypothetical protein